jgi:hypothetical protein
MTLDDRLDAAMNKLAKWRTVFVGWQLGTRMKGDPEGDALRDHREVTILLRAEVSALTALLLDKGVCSKEELQRALLEEARALDELFQERFPGISTSSAGVEFSARAAETMRGWPP